MRERTRDSAEEFERPQLPHTVWQVTAQATTDARRDMPRHERLRVCCASARVNSYCTAPCG